MLMADEEAPDSASPWLDRLAARPRAALLLVVLLAWLPGFFILPPLDRDESRFAESSRQMVETGNLIDIRFAGAARYNKPVAIYWLQSASAALAGPAMRGRIWIYRLPSLVGGYLSLIFLYASARSFAGRKTALLASALLGTTLLLTAESDIATTDAALLATVIAAQGAMMGAYLAARAGARPALPLMLAGWAAMGIGVLLKGPVIVAVLGVTAAGLSLWDRDWRWLLGTRPLSGMALAALLVAPWAIAIGLASHGAFYQQSLGHDFAAKILGGEESHGAPPGYYLALASITFWPATLLLLPAIGCAMARRGEPVYRYLLAWSGAVWLMFELVPTKLPHYILPAYPALALLASLWASQGMTSQKQPVLHALALAQFAVGTVALAATCVFLPAHFGGMLRWDGVAGMAIALVFASAAAVSLLRRSGFVAAGFATAAALAFYLVLAFCIAPELSHIWLSPRVSNLVERIRRPDDPPIVIAGYVEPSLVFLLGSDTRIEEGRAAGRLSAAQGGLALVEQRGAPGFFAGLASSGARATAVGSVSGLDYSTGREQRIILYRVARSLRPPALPKS